MFSITTNFHKNKPYYLPLLLLISIASHVPFVLTGYGELDATRIGVSAIDMAKYGSEGAFTNYYFTDVIPLYMLYLKWFLKLIGHKFEFLPAFMNYTNAIFGTLAVIPSYILIRRLFSNQGIAFYSVLALIFAPAFYQSTISGFPHLISFFFLMCSFCFYLKGIDDNQKDFISPWMILVCLSLSVALLFKLDYILGVGAYFGFLYMRKITDKRKFISTFVIIAVSCLIFFLFRYLIIGSTGGATSSGTGFSGWFNVFVSSSSTSIAYLKRQIKPVMYAAGIITFLLGTIAFVYHLVKRNFDVLVFNLSWAALPTITWIIINGNNARHNMFSILPFLVIIVMLFIEKAPKYILPLTVMLILGNYFVVSPSSSILTPSGNLIKSHTLLENRMVELHTKAKEILSINGDKIVVLGYFHNPHVIFEILSSVSSYEAVKIGREDYKIKADGTEYIILYFIPSASENMELEINSLLNNHELNDHVIVSATYDLNSLNKRGLKTRTLSLIKSAL